MAIRVALLHRTTYQFDRQVGLSPHEIRLRPAPHCRTPVLGYSLKVEPDGYFLNWQQDPYGNWVARLVFTERADRLSITVDLIADMTVTNPFDFFVEPYAEKYPFAYAPALAKELIPFLETAPLSPRFAAWLDAFRATIGPEELTVDLLVRLNMQLQREVRYLVRMEPGVQTPEQTLERGCGSCRDSGWLLVQIMRHLGIAARFASGYLIQLVADVKPLDGPSGPDRDFTDLHAWAEAFIPGAGWIGFDPTSGLLAGEGHLPLACTADPGNAAPVIGYTDVCETKFDFAMQVTRIHEDPRVTKPYTESQWEAINALGERVDADLVAGDVRLTQGGEPTFVSVDDMDGAEWNYLAMSPKKRELAEHAAAPARALFRCGRAAASGTGQMVSGRAAAALGAGHLLAHGRRAAVAGRGAVRGHALRPGPRRCRRPANSASASSRRSACRRAIVITAHEDVPKLLIDEALLPVNVDPFAADLTKPGERARLARLLKLGLDKPAGFVLPLQGRRVGDEAHGLGDAAAGRCGASACTRSPAIRRWACGCRSARCRTSCRRSRTSIRRSIRSRRSEPLPKRGDMKPRPGRIRGEAPREVIKTALTLEMRGGHVHVFMPPLVRFEAYSQLLAAIEDTARALSMHVVIEGYAPPRDARVRVLAVTPDPGVIEVNIHPAASWRELIATTTTLYEEARQTRLATEKFMLDGRHMGTGGGNHVTLGGATPADSPLLRRPDLLRSLITYWQNHPALSYLFSGMFIGPTQPGAARRRGARRPPVRARDRVPAAGRRSSARRRGDRAAVARRSPAAPPADRPHRQHAPRRILDRQAVFARQPDRPARPARIPRVRDAAACADERRADAAAARAGRALLADALPGQADPLGHRAARSLAAAAFRRRRHARRRRRSRPRSATRSRRNGSTRSSNSASRASAPSTTTA